MCNFLIGEHDVNVESVVYEHCVQTDRYELLEVVSACDTMMDGLPKRWMKIWAGKSQNALPIETLF
jgi:hypothetical protein